MKLYYIEDEVIPAIEICKRKDYSYDYVVYVPFWLWILHLMSTKVYYCTNYKMRNIIEKFEENWYR